MIGPRHSRLSPPAAVALLGLLCAALPVVGAAPPPRDDAQDRAFFDKEVRPLLETHCLKCHGAEEKIKGGLRLTSRGDLLKGGDLGPVLAPANPADSLLLRAISYKDDKLQMPPKGKLPPEAIATLTKWVEMGAPFPPGSLVAAKGVAHEKVPTPQDAKSFW